jgi:amino acid transporter
LTLSAGPLLRRSLSHWHRAHARIVGPDYISLIGGEVKNPRRILPKAFKSTIWRLIFFYVVGAFCVGIVVGANDPSLLGAIAAGAPGAAKSPYVICG